MKNLYDINDWKDVTEHQRLGEILLQSGEINLIHLGMALDIQRFENLSIGEILIKMKILDEKVITQALLIQKQIDEFISQNIE